mmetsp:Transcript_20111/g.31920  ORF Transcript_20111/g.31920 Transcript_20111/m.31920 type:complete len:660 (-) Transcript_20111:166-2145(-)
MEARIKLSKISCVLPQVQQSAFIEADFDYIGEGGRTEIRRDTKTPRFTRKIDVEFSAVASNLLTASCTLTLRSVNIFSTSNTEEHLIIGSVKCRLDTLMLAPKKHQLLLWKKGKAVGKIFFHCSAECKTLAKIQLLNVGLHGLPETKPKAKPFLGVSLIQRTSKPLQQPEFPHVFTPKSSTWTWKKVSALSLMAGTMKLMKTSIIVNLHFKENNVFASARVPMAKIMEASFAGRDAEVKSKMRISRGSSLPSGSIFCTAAFTVRATRLCKYAQMQEGVHLTGKIVDGRHIFPDLPTPILKHERPNDYHEQYAQLKRLLEAPAARRSSISRTIQALIAVEEMKRKEEEEEEKLKTRSTMRNNFLGAELEKDVVQGKVYKPGESPEKGVIQGNVFRPGESSTPIVEGTAVKAGNSGLSVEGTVLTSEWGESHQRLEHGAQPETVAIAQGVVVRPSDHVEGTILSRDSKSRSPSRSRKGKWRRVPVRFLKRPFGFHLASEGKKTWVDTVSRSQLKGKILPNSRIYKIDGIPCSDMGFKDIVALLRTCKVPCVIKFKVPPPDTHGPRDSILASRAKQKKFNEWYDVAVHPSLEHINCAPLNSPHSPPVLAPGWEVIYDSNSKLPFYRNKFTGKTQWEVPTKQAVQAWAPQEGDRSGDSKSFVI